MKNMEKIQPDSVNTSLLPLSNLCYNQAQKSQLSKQGGSEHQIHEHQIQKSGSVNNKW